MHSEEGYEMSEKVPPAKMPAEFLKPEPRNLKDLPEGDEAFVLYTAIRVELDGSVWVDTDVRVSEKRTLETVLVKNLGGGYALTLPLRHKYTPERIPEHLFSKDMFRPVVEIVEDKHDPRAGLGG
jgi:hypothetical protein